MTYFNTEEYKALKELNKPLSKDDLDSIDIPDNTKELKELQHGNQKLVKIFDSLKDDIKSLSKLFTKNDQKAILKVLDKINKNTKKKQQLNDYSTVLENIFTAVQNDDIVLLLKQILKRKYNVILPEIFPVDLDPSLIERNRIKTVLPDKQVDKISKAVKGAMGGVSSAPVVKKLNKVIEAVGSYDTLIDDYTTTNKTYIGKATTGTLESDSNWQIKCMDETGDYLRIKYADGASAFSKEWDERTTYNYS